MAICSKYICRLEQGNFPFKAQKLIVCLEGKISTSTYNKTQETSTQIPLLVLKKDQVCMEKACFKKQINKM